MYVYLYFSRRITADTTDLLNVYYRPNGLNSHLSECIVYLSDSIFSRAYLMIDLLTVV
jgi:hypothetical protein